MGWLCNMLVTRSVRSRLATARTFPVDLQRAIAKNLADFINTASIDDALLPSFLEAAMQERHDAIAAGASSKKDHRWVLASLKEDWCVARLGKAKGIVPVAVADTIAEQIEGFTFGSGRRAHPQVRAHEPEGHMLFPRRRWAVRVVEKTDIPVTSRAGATLVDFVIWASKQHQQVMQQSIGKSLPTAELVFLAASTMANNQSAVVRLAEELAVDVGAAENALVQLSKAARTVAAEYGYTKIVEMIDRDTLQGR